MGAGDVFLPGFLEHFNEEFSVRAAMPDINIDHISLVSVEQNVRSEAR